MAKEVAASEHIIARIRFWTFVRDANINIFQTVREFDSIEYFDAFYYYLSSIVYS